MKGIAKIELTDVNTGERKVVKEQNMSTNVLKQLFSMPEKAFVWDMGPHGSSLMNVSMPLYQRALGGLLIFSETIPEDPNIMYPEQLDLTLTGQASGVYTGANLRRGTLNNAESVAVENGWRWVWDFPTDRANGEIGCLCLTSLLGGAAMYNPDNNIDQAAGGMSNNNMYSANQSAVGATAFDAVSPWYYNIPASEYLFGMANLTVKLDADDNGLVLYSLANYTANAGDNAYKYFIVRQTSPNRLNNLSVCRPFSNFDNTPIRTAAQKSNRMTDYTATELEGNLRANNMLPGYENFSGHYFYMKEANILAATWFIDAITTTGNVGVPRNFRHMEWNLTTGKLLKDKLIYVDTGIPFSYASNVVGTRWARYDGEHFIARGYMYDNNAGTQPFRFVRFSEDGTVIDEFTFPTSLTGVIYDSEQGVMWYTRPFYDYNTKVLYWWMGGQYNPRYYFVFKNGKYKGRTSGYFDYAYDRYRNNISSSYFPDNAGYQVNVAQPFSWYPLMFDFSYVSRGDSAAEARQLMLLSNRVRPLYLATINNLANKVIKTSAQTMKVTYEITN